MPSTLGFLCIHLWYNKVMNSLTADVFTPNTVNITSGWRQNDNVLTRQSFFHGYLIPLTKQVLTLLNRSCSFTIPTNIYPACVLYSIFDNNIVIEIYSSNQQILHRMYSALDVFFLSYCLAVEVLFGPYL